MSAQRHGARTGTNPTGKALIESMIALGKGVDEMVEESGKTRQYVLQLVGLSSRSARDAAPAGDCDKHLELVFAGGKPFPSIRSRPHCRVRA